MNATEWTRAHEYLVEAWLADEITQTEYEEQVAWLARQ